jgi:hypothetical protein
MKKYFILSHLFCCIVSGISYAQSEKTEEIIKQMETAGKLKRIGNTLEFQMDKPSDTVQVRKKYETIFKKPDGSNYEIKFSIDPKYIQNNKQVLVNKLPQNNQPGNTVAGTPGAPVTGPVNNNSTGCCCSNMKVFGYIGVGSDRNPAPLFAEYNWTVPAGVTKIKIEAWSAGGDGWYKIITENVFRNDTIKGINGGGGGGGAYGFAMVTVTPGDIIKMRVPGGGSNAPLIIDFPNTRIGYLNLMSGRNAKESNTNVIFNGTGGKLITGSGVFSENSFFLRGTDGQTGWLSDYNNNTDNVTRTGWGGAPRADRYDNFDLHGGDGGDAPKSTRGGIGSKFISSTRKFIPAKDGGYPGSGGGGGGYISGLESGKGAPGVIIIYY